MPTSLTKGSTQIVNLQSRLVDVWTWLPAFRAVAELEHVQEASRRLHVTASSLSRAIRLLEEHLERRLFDRVGRNLKLTHEGQLLLRTVRDAMRLIDDGIGHVTGTTFVGEVHVACEGDLPISFVWRAATRLMKQYPALRTAIESASADFGAKLLRGEIDLAVVTAAPPARTAGRLLIEHLYDINYGVYCGEEHPLYEVRRPSLDSIRKHAFVGPTSSVHSEARDVSTDQWPSALERIVTLHLPALEPAIEACAAGDLLAVLPDIAVAQSTVSARLRRLPCDEIASSPLFAVRRRPTNASSTSSSVSSPSSPSPSPSSSVDRVGALVSELRKLDPALLSSKTGGALRKAGRRVRKNGQ